METKKTIEDYENELFQVYKLENQVKGGYYKNEYDERIFKTVLTTLDQLKNVIRLDISVLFKNNEKSKNDAK